MRTRTSRWRTAALVAAVGLSAAACTVGTPDEHAGTESSPSGPGAHSSTPASTEPPPAPAVPIAAPPSTSPPNPGPTPAEVAHRAASNVDVRPLRPGETPPQFVLFSFDGAGWHERWQEFLAAADRVDARFTGFLSGTYLLTDAHRDAYRGPGHARGVSEVGFGGSAAQVEQEVRDLNQAYAAGDEIGTHYNGHFCDEARPGGGQWTAAQWRSELDQYFTVVQSWKSIDDLPGAPDLQVPSDSIVGGRLPCLEGRFSAVLPAWRAHHMTYDTSGSGSIAWPRKVHGIWEFPMQYVASPAFGNVTAMDYNFWFKFNGAKNDPAAAPAIRAKVLATYEHMYDVARLGNRAPLVIGNHFNGWSGNAFNPAVKDFMLEVCDDPGTVCATYSDVVAWMQAQDPKELAHLQSLPAVR
ncbi:polysaccharide deacetylase family protein [Cellulomonas alba]|uniref:Polysaccharide deacetylase n=1 Tax=Cellulomonas alba TaxID=3053467 RepID=A0ABT7SHF1_9CELL|nr:polysaccharide deacetylase [Cellulomonas alba]MDM7855600.1 polysaccharide deacetylase [Cellulomonas alba]